MTDTVDKIIIQSETRGVQQTTNEVQGLSKAMDGVSVSSEKVERSSISLDNKFASLERRFSTTAGQAAQLEKIQKTVNDAVAQNPALQSRANDILAAASTRIITTARANEQLAKSTGLARHELVNLSRQAQDFAVSLGSGQSFGTVLLQQGTQIADVFANSQGSVKGFFEQVGSGALRLLTPMRVLAGGVAGVGAAALYIGSNWAEAERQIGLALTGIGRRSGETLQSINRFSTENASLTGLSISEARNVAIEFARLGTVAVSNLKGVGEAVRGYSILTGKDATEATKELAGALGGDLVQAAMKVDATYGVMNAATLENIRALEAQGKRAEAVQIILDRMAPSNLKAAESVGILSKAWTGLTNIFSNVVNGAPLDAGSPQTRVDDVTRRRDEFPGSNIGRNDRGELVQFANAAAKAEAFRKELAAAQQALDAFNADKANAALDALSTKAFAATNAILPQVDAISKLDNAIRQIQEAQSKGVAPALSTEAIAVLQRQRDLQQESLNATIRQAEFVGQLQAAWGGVSSQTAVTLQNLRGQLQVAQAVTGAAQMHAQQQATVNNLLAEGRSLEEASAIAREQRAVAEANATATIEKQTQSLKDQNEMIKARARGTEASTAAAIAYRNAIESGADETAAAALKAETLKNNILQAASAAGNLGQRLSGVAETLASIAAQNALPGDLMQPGYAGVGPSQGVTYGDGGHGEGGFFSRENDYRMGQGGTSRGGTFAQGSDPISRAGSAPLFWQSVPLKEWASMASPLAKTHAMEMERFQDALDKINAEGAKHEIDALQTVLDTIDTDKAIDKMNAFRDGLADFLGGSSNKEERIAGMALQINSLANGLAEHPENIWSIASLQRSMEELRNATDENTEATLSVTLNPLYNGRDALKVGYYKAAKGLDMIAQGPTSGDQVPFHAMVNGGERITITPAGQQPANNDNSKTIVNNNTFVFGSQQSANRRSERQAAQGFGQMMAGLS